MPNQIIEVTLLGNLFKCTKFQCNLKKQTRIIPLFQKCAEIEDFKSVTHFSIIFFSTSVSSVLNKAKDYKEQQIEPTNAYQP